MSDAFLSSFFASVFPYELTGAQQRAIADVRADIAQPIPMNRLLQGDVGSGKTAVALVSLVMAFVNGKQSALMAPTSILAEQHYRGISAMLAKMTFEHKPRVALLTSAVSASERDTILRDLAEGAIDIVIGTHALI
ncbi:MAG: DEAD/DEAH box helicase, partial [Blastochloris sp.]|nr:DEAD/DEAH box helicase [Blastochloris sp.]